MFVIGQESMHYVQVKQAFLLLPGISSRLSSRTVLFTNVPKPFLNEAILRETFPSIESVWIASDTEKLDDLIEKRDETAMKLEGAEIKLLGKANEKRLKAMKTGEPEKEIEDPMHWLDEKKRPKFRKKFLKLPVGQKVDLIDWCRDQLQEIIPKVREEQTHIKIRESFPTKGEVKYNSAVFIEFHDVKAAQSAFRKTHTKLPEGFEPRTTGTQPLEIIWKNLNMGKVQRKFRSTLATILVVALTIAWTPFTTCVGGLSNVDDLAQTPHLDWISKIPPKFVGVVTGLIPVVILRISLRLVPTVMRRE